MIDEIIELIQEAFQYIKNLFRKVINGILSFVRDVVGYFRRLNLRQGHDVPFIANKEQFKQALKEAPVKQCGIFKGVYNEDTDEITTAEYMEADQLDAETKQTLKQGSIVVLS